jgi:glyoxylase-like metal-dependent hydrolase (beta-lactamase superfamily II)
MREIVDGVYVLDGLKTGRAYLVEGEGALCLVDSSTGGAAPRILDAMRGIGGGPEDLKVIVATHYHYDHTGNVAALVERTGAQLWAHTADVPYIEGTERWLGAPGLVGKLLDEEQYTLNVDRALNDGDELRFGGGLRVIHTPGHTPGHIALYSRSRSTLFAGDAFGNFLGLRVPVALYSHDMEVARQSIRVLARLEFDVALPGHGYPVVSRASEKVQHWVSAWF